MAQAARTRRRRTPAPELRDPPVESGAGLTIMSALRQYRDESQRAREPRLKQTKRNWDVFMGKQDWSHKLKGQSREFLPKVAMAKEQIASFIERGLTDFGDWFSPEFRRPAPLTDVQARRLLQYQLDQSSANGANSDEDFPAVIADAVTVALLGSLMVLKVHGRMMSKQTFRVERGYEFLTMPDGYIMPRITQELIRDERDVWQTVIDLIPPEDYLPDPLGRNLYEMHEVERDLADVQKMADAGVYDPEVVKRIEEDYAEIEERLYRTREQHRENREPSTPGFRKRVVILECWGTILNERGRIAEENVVCAMANNKYLIRPPEDNFYWHRERPFVTRPLLRVPFSVWHKALFDHAVDLNIALNEIYNLMLDGGMASVWGNKQVRPEFLDDPRQIKDGIPQGETLVVKEGAPPTIKVLEQVATGQVPREAFAIFQATQQEIEVATQVNAVRLGQTPGAGTTATAVMEAQSQSNTFFDGLIRDTEKMITKALTLMWSNTMQFFDDLDSEEVVTAIGEQAALTLSRMTPAERFSSLAGCTFKVSGLSAIVARVRDFQKLLALLQVAGQNQIMGMAFIQRFSPHKIWSHLFKSINLDPSTLEPDEQERMQQPAMMQMLMQGQGGQGQGGAGTGAAPMPGAPPGVGGMAPEVPGNLPAERMPVGGAGGY